MEICWQRSSACCSPCRVVTASKMTDNKDYKLLSSIPWSLFGKTSSIKKGLEFLKNVLGLSAVERTVTTNREIRRWNTPIWPPVREIVKRNGTMKSQNASNAGLIESWKEWVGACTGVTSGMNKWLTDEYRYLAGEVATAWISHPPSDVIN